MAATLLLLALAVIRGVGHVDTMFIKALDANGTVELRRELSHALRCRGRSRKSDRRHRPSARGESLCPRSIRPFRLRFDLDKAQLRPIKRRFAGQAAPGGRRQHLSNSPYNRRRPQQ